MKKLIDEMDMSIKEFSETFNIPYNTVRQWYNGDRKPPIYIKEMIKKIIELRSQGRKQLKVKLKLDK